MLWIRLGTIGWSTLATTGATVWATSGWSALNASLYASGTTASFTSGLPSRETWTYGPSLVTPLALTLTARSAVLDQTPITGLRVAFPLYASSFFGICRPRVLTL